MTAFMPNPLGNTTQYLARQRLLALIDSQKLFKAVDADPGIVGAGVVWIDSDYNVITLREFQPICSLQPKRLILRETPRYLSPEQFKAKIETDPRESGVLWEAFNMGLACGSAYLGWLVMVNGTMAAPFTGGASLVLTVLGYAAAAAGTAQCGIGLVRTGFEMYDPSLNDALDGDDFYNDISWMLDVVALAGVVSTAKSTVQFILARKRATGQSWRQLTKALSRQQRKALATELLALEHPTLTARQLKLRQATGALPKRMTPTQVNTVTTTRIQDATGGVLGLVGSGLVRRGLSEVKGLAIGLYEEIKE
ncbi:NAD synthetase [Pseudomonas fakonensis]|uniref:NAD synthetase n=1 Tax=Pseudomonas fakonensis TaxID=2842355 RepID=A0ABX8N6A0_9PSED|nr:NAD synthetase [Pseudomonas fakonensis]QXH51845.1 NAD synthetase [Pseudomonas fakonensis]